MRARSGGTVAWVVGHAVTECGAFLRQGESFELPPGHDVPSFAQSLNGRFVVVELGRPDPIVHPDGCGSLGTVYAPAEESVASTSGLIPVSRHTPFALDRILSTDIPYRDAMYPLGLTPRIGVERLLPNHSLDCGSWTTIRNWPLEPIARVEGTGPFEHFYMTSVQATLRAVAATYPLDLTLTGGRDSRLMLACMRGIATPLMAYTAKLSNITAWEDVRLAERVAAHAGLRHRTVGARTGSRDLLRWAQRTAGETGEPNGWRGAAALAAQAAGRATITGVTADVSRLDGYAPGTLTEQNTPEVLLRRCRVGHRPEFLARARQWLDGLGHLDGISIVALFHIEQRLGCWSAVIEYGELGSASARLCPTTSGAIVRGSLALPDDYRLERQLHERVIAAAWPELLDVPFNEGISAPRWLREIFRLRKRLGGATATQARRVRRRLARARARYFPAV